MRGISEEIVSSKRELKITTYPATYPKQISPD
jgi:hypothetical protein